MNREALMQRCLDLAQLGEYSTRPNPMVGALLYRDGVIIAEGWHQYPGGAHAEVNCFDNCPDDSLLAESTLFVSLEPCSHHGKTPPCADLIIRKKVKKVIAAMQDPNPLVAGQGLEKIRAAGIEAEFGVLEAEARFLNRRFIHFFEKKQPWFTLKWAEDAAGHIGKQGERISISGEAALRFGHQLRASHHAILVGKNTLLSDNPSLDTRFWPGPSPTPILLDSRLETLDRCDIYKRDTPVYIINEVKEEEQGRIRFLKVQRGPGFWEILSDKLFQAGIQSVLVEGGAQVQQQLLESGFAKEIYRIQSDQKSERADIPAPVIPGNFGLLGQFPSIRDQISHYIHA